MIRSAVLLVRTSTLSVMFLTAALFTLGSVLFDDPAAVSEPPGDPFPSLAPITRPPAGERARAIPASALFDPARRPETLSGPIDDLRPKSETDAVQAPVTLSGVLLDGGQRKAMLTLGAGSPVWSAVGADIGGWRVASIDREGAVIERNGESLALRIADRYKLRPKAASTASPDQPPAAPDQPPDLAAPDASAPGVP